jgi:hypothetical protein
MTVPTDLLEDMPSTVMDAISPLGRELLSLALTAVYIRGYLAVEVAGTPTVFISKDDGPVNNFYVPAYDDMEA